AGRGGRLLLGAAGGDRVHGLHDEEEDRGGDQHERQQRVDEIAIQELAVVDLEVEPREVLVPADGGDERGDEVGDEGGNHRAERGGDHHRHGQVDDVSAQKECLELLEHREPPGWFGG